MSSSIEGAGLPVQFPRGAQTAIIGSHIIKTAPQGSCQQKKSVKIIWYSVMVIGYSERDVKNAAELLT